MNAAVVRKWEAVAARSEIQPWLAPFFREDDSKATFQDELMLEGNR
jgi:hypothetical protein